MREVAHAAAAVGLVHGDTQQAHVSEGAPEFMGECVVAIDVGGTRRDFPLAHVVDSIAELVDIFAQAEIEIGVGRVHGPFPLVDFAVR